MRCFVLPWGMGRRSGPRGAGHQLHRTHPAARLPRRTPSGRFPARSMHIPCVRGPAGPTAAPRAWSQSAAAQGGRKRALLLLMGFGRPHTMILRRAARNSKGVEGVRSGRRAGSCCRGARCALVRGPHVRYVPSFPPSRCKVQAMQVTRTGRGMGLARAATGIRCRAQGAGHLGEGEAEASGRARPSLPPCIRRHR
jgi:hypothetical protein